MIQYFNELHNIRISYLDWVLTAYPMVIVVLPAIAFIIWYYCKPRSKDLSHVQEELKSEIAASGNLGVRDWLTIGIFLLTLTLWLTMSSTWGLGIVALIGAALYLVTGCVEWRDLNSGVNWGAVLLYAAAMSMGVAMVKTKAAAWIATNFLAVLNATGIGSGIGLIIAVALLITIVTNSMSSGAAVAVMAPITLLIAQQAGMSIVVMGFVTVIASAFGFISVGSHPGITIVYSSGLMPAREFLKIGWKIALTAVVILVIFASTYLHLLHG
jgi:sodium-dependent dicarboxylate transporter 2/3/5